MMSSMICFVEQRSPAMKCLKNVVVCLVLITATTSRAQVITPFEISDPKARNLQQRYIKALITIGDEIEAHKFPYPFYFSRVLDVDMAKVKVADQRSIRFDFYEGETVLEITGNYYAAYSADRMDSYARMKETFLTVVMPMLQAAVAHFPDDSAFPEFAIEVSHHVLLKVMGVSEERPENLTVIIPVAAAQKLVDAKNIDERQAAVLEARVFLNGQPAFLWLQEGAPTDEWIERYTPPPTKKQSATPALAAAGAPGAPSQSVSPSILKSVPMRIISPDVLAKLQTNNQDEIDRMAKGLDKEAHFIPYAPPPSFIAFRQGAYLQLSINTTLDTSASSSRYKLAALAFDEHVSHLIRPLLDYFPPDVDFDGVAFSSILKLGGEASAGESVEFFLPYRMMRCFASYDCTGQQLLDSGTVLINGERSALDLQVAEGKN
jgi:hypothetical protein